MNLYCPGVTNLPSPNHSDRRGADVRALVLHIEGGSDTATQAWFTNPDSVASAHFSVAKDGSSHQYVSCADAAWANGIIDTIDHGHATAFLASLPPTASPNRYSISIEHEGDSGDEMTAEQFAESVRIAAWVFGPGGAMDGVQIGRAHV